MKDKKAHSKASNAVFATKWIYKFCKTYLFIIIFGGLISLILSVYSTYVSKWIIDTLQSDDAIINIMLIIFGICFVPVVLNLFSAVINVLKDIFYAKFAHRIAKYTLGIRCSLDYDKMENPDYKVLFQQYSNYTRNSTVNIVSLCSKFIFDIIKVIIFGSLISTLHPAIFFLLAFLAIVQYFIKKPLAKYSQKLNKFIIANDRRFDYSTSISRDMENAKEVRIYGMSGWLNGINDDCMKEHIRLHSLVQNRTVLIGLGIHLLNFIRDGFAYIYLIYLFANGNMTPGNFVLYFTAITTVSVTLNSFANSLSEIEKNSVQVDEVRTGEALALSSRNHGVGVTVPSSAPEIEFVGVSYRYLTANDDTIKNISFKINSGERIALVGVNGAGKTTLIKLMCGLYRPTSGRILYNGHDIDEYNIDEFYTLFSAVFQNVYTIPYSIMCHIAATTEETMIDRNRVSEAICQAGLKNKIDTLPNGMDTLLCKDVNRGGVELSGGELQKLSLARAIYLSRPVLLLDEPTAALDPIAESEMYERFDSTVGIGKTAVFISHRLASTHFCDRIFHLEGGEIIESGTHDELMAAGGKYREMFDLQSSYYKDEKSDAP